MKVRDVFLLLLLFLPLVFAKILGNYIGDYVSYDGWQCFLIAVILLLLLLAVIFCIVKKSPCTEQFLAPVTLLALFWNGSLISSKSPSRFSEYSILMALAINLSGVLLLCYIIKKYGRRAYTSIRHFILNNLYEIIIGALFILGSIPLLNSWLSPGSYDYYEHVRVYIGNWDCLAKPIERLKICEHICQSYGLFAGIGAFMTPDSVVGPRVIHILMACVTILLYGMIVRKLWRGLPRFIYTLLVAIFAFSPLLFGLVGEINPDFAVLCFLVWLVWAKLYGFEVLELFFSLLLCFSKETGVVLYGMYLVGVVLAKFLSQSKRPLPARIKGCILTKQVLFPSITGYCWVLLHFTDSIPLWDGDVATAVERPVNVFSFDLEYIVYKFHQLLSPNFSWLHYLIFFIAILVYFYFVIVNRRGHGTNGPVKISTIDFSFVCYTASCFAGFLIVTFFYVTWTNYRYLIPYLFFLGIISGTGVYILYTVLSATGKDLSWVCEAILYIAFILTICSNYKTLDHMFLASPYTYDVGKDRLTGGEMFYTDDEKGIIADETVEGFACIGLVYNREYLELGNVMEDFLASVNYTSKDLILLPYQFNMYVSYNNFLYRRYEFGATNLYWDTNENALTVNCAMKDYSDISGHEKFNVKVYINIDDYLAEYNNYENIYYIELPFVDDNIIDFKSMAISEKKYSSWNYILKTYKLK